MEIGNDVDPDYPEHWPREQDLPGFKATMNRFHLACHQLHLRIMSLLAIALQLDVDYFTPSISTRSHCLRLLHYPPTERSDGDTRIGSHTDFGTVSINICLIVQNEPHPLFLFHKVTLLWQDETGGLEVTGPDGKWASVEPKPDTFVINMYVQSLYGRPPDLRRERAQATA